MKLKYITLAFLICSSVSSAAMAENGTSSTLTTAGGFTGPVHTISTVQSVMDAGLFSDDQPVALTGYITQSLGGELYQFQDETGTINVEIDDDEWRGQVVSPTTKVIIMGEIEKELTHTTVDVNSIRVAQ